MANETRLIARGLGFPEAARQLATQLGFPHFNPWSDDIGALTRYASRGHQRRSNEDIVLKDSETVPGVERRIVQPQTNRFLRAPLFLNEAPRCLKTHDLPNSLCQELNIIVVHGGAVCNFMLTPLIVGCDATTVLLDYSSKFCHLLHYYDFPICSEIENSRFIDGTVLVLFDDLQTNNYCHWLVDWIPRLAGLRDYVGRRDVYVATSRLATEFQRTSLRLCGFPDDRILTLGSLEAVRARELVVPNSVRDINHPAHRAAPWATDFLRSQLGIPAVVDAGITGRQRKLYVSREDANGRRILNEDALLQRLSAVGYEKIVPSRLTFQEQVATFAGASHIIGPHGAGLTNLIFSRQGSEILEIFPRSYGTPAYYLLATGSGRRYSCYVADKLFEAADPPFDDCGIDMDSFERSCGEFLASAGRCPC
jgi:hypothetical protein